MTLKNITILGSGIMGHGIAQVSAMAGYNVILRDIEKRFLDNAMDKIKWSLQKLAEKQKISKDQAEKYYQNITPKINIGESVSEADIIIEAVPEDFNIKKKVYQELDAVVSNPNTIYASNTSTLPISELSQLTIHKNRFIGVHFFNPPQLMKLVEVIPGIDTDNLVIKQTTSYVNSLGKVPILCKKDVAGFIVNRIFIPMVHEALYAMERDNVSKEIIDSAVKYNMNFPMGVFELADYTGLDVIHKASSEMYSRDKEVIFPHPRVKELYEEKKLGQKSGSGFYDYRGENYERIELSNEKASKYEPLSILGVAINNSAWLISNDVCTKNDLENALRLGMGIKTELFETYRNYGHDKVIHKLQELERKHGNFYHPNSYLERI